MQYMETKGTKIPSVMPPYFLPRKPSAKPIKDPKYVKFDAFTQLLP